MEINVEISSEEKYRMAYAEAPIKKEVPPAAVSSAGNISGFLPRSRLTLETQVRIYQ